MSLEALRAAFPSLGEGSCFLDWGSTGLLASVSRDVAAGYLDALVTPPQPVAARVHLRGAALLAALRSEAAALIGAEPDEIACVGNTTEGILAVKDALALVEGDNVIASSIDYPALVQPWKRLERDGIELRLDPHSEGEIPPEGVVELMDERTRLVALSSVSWTSGALLALGAVGAETRMRGIPFLLDAVQSLGVVPLDVGRTPVSFVACGGHKWLCGVPGSGFFFARRLVAARYQPSSVGLLAARPPQGTLVEWFMDPQARPDEELFVHATARSFESGGTPDYGAAAALAASLALIRAADPVAILEHVRALGERLIAGLDRLGFALVTPRDPSRRAGIVVFRPPGGSADEAHFVNSLEERGIAIARRWCGGVGGLRACLHGMNLAADVDRLLDGLEDLLRDSRSRPREARRPTAE